MNNIRIKKVVLILLILVFCTSFIQNVVVAHAETLEYTVLAPLPGTYNEGTGKADLRTYIPGMFNLIIGLAAVIAVANIIFGGFQYITTDAIQGKSAGRDRIRNAIYGLIMISAAWLILYTINPRLLELDLNIGAIRAPANLPNLATGQCTECVTINGITTKAGIGTQLKLDTLQRLRTLDASLEASGMALVVNEAFPPTRTHANVCHQNASCVDAAKVADSKINDYVTKSKQAGLRSIFEVETNQRKTEILAASCGINQSCRNELGSSIMVLPPRPDGTRQITGEHFSIYNCNIDAVSCR